jgi:hypothetical protein
MQQMHSAYTEGIHTHICPSPQLNTMSFNNCCLTITDIATPDPFVIYAFGRYYMVSSAVVFTIKPVTEFLL